MNHPIRKKDRKWLAQIRNATDTPIGMYPGVRVDHIPDSVAHRLTKRGRLIKRHVPHNRAHKQRWIVTRRGRELLRPPPTANTPSRSEP